MLTKTMRIISYNVNGIRAALKKNFTEWLASDPADIICLQEIKAVAGDVNWTEIENLGYHVHLFSAQKKGYSGVAILSKRAIAQVICGQAKTQSDSEGRVLQVRTGDYYIVNTYFPSGSSGDERQAYKMEFLRDYVNFIRPLIAQEKKLLVVGDYNICHHAIDIHDPVGNKNSSGFLPEERAWMDTFFDLGLTDTFRAMHPDKADAYSWWSYRAQARTKNKGWRIDYISASPALVKKLRAAEILPHVQHSDHCPVYAEFSDD